MPLRHTVSMFASILCTLVWTASAWAQFPTLVVVPGDVASMTLEQEWMDIVEESAFVATDFGVYEVHRYYEMPDMIDPALADVVLDCRADSQCVADMLYGSPFAFALHVNVEPVPAGIAVTYRLVDIELGLISGQSTALMADPRDFQALQNPAFQALRGETVAQPDLSVPAPVATPATPFPPGQSGTAGPATTEPRNERPSEPRDRQPVSSMARAGRLTAVGGGLLLAAGVLVGFAADNTLQTIQSEPHERGELESLQTTGKNQQRLANIMFAVGGTALAAGVTLSIVDRTRSNDSGVTLDLRAQPAGRWVGLRLRF